MFEYNAAVVSPRAGPWLYIAEMEHRVANEYAIAVSTIALAAAGSSDAGVKATLGGAAQRLRDCANVHRSLQAPLYGGRIDLADYLRPLLDCIVRASLSPRGVNLTYVERSIEIDAQRCWQVGLVVSELVTNAVRHGLSAGGAIVVEVDRRGDQVRCWVSDNGRCAPNPCGGNGTRLVDCLARELGGRVEREFTPDGARVLLTFPTDPADKATAASPAVEPSALGQETS